VVAKNNLGQPVALDGGVDFFLLGTTTSTVTAVSYNGQGAFMIVILADGSTYKIADTNPQQFANFKFRCNL